MPGLVPGIHAVRHRGASRARARRRRGVDARNKSGHDENGPGAEERPPRKLEPDTARRARRTGVPPYSRIGRDSTGLPVRAKIALAIAGASGGRPGSPTPVGGSSDGTICTSTGGMSGILGMT